MLVHIVIGMRNWREHMIGNGEMCGAHKYPPVPMQNSSLQSELNRMISDGGQPEDTYRNHIFPTMLSLSELEGAPEAFKGLLESMLDDVVPVTRKSMREQYKACGEQLLLNLSKASLVRCWLCISGNKNNYQGDPSDVFPSFRIIDRWCSLLEGEGLITKKEGKAYTKGRMLNRYFPNQELQKLLIGFSLGLESPISPPYQRINDPEKAFSKFIWPQDHDERIFLESFNEFASGNTWALKGPIIQVFKHNPFQNGRLITPFQNLPNRKYKIRSNTLINANPVVEVDFNANHFRLFMAFNKRPYQGDDPYQEIADLTVRTRAEVKGFINIALNCQSFEQAAAAALKEWSVPISASKKINDYLGKKYPEVNLYSNFGLTAMHIEGLILTQVLSEGMKQNIFCLPIHDAIAVEAKNSDWAASVMEQTWYQIVNQMWFANTERQKTLNTVVRY